MAIANVPDLTPASAATPAPPQHPLRDRNFRLLFTGSTISLVGDQFYFVALPWLVLQQTGSAVAMGTVMMAAAIPRVVLMLLGGAVSDRFSPRRVMMAGACARTFCVIVMGLLAGFHVLRMWMVYTLAVAFGIADAFDGPAGSALVPFLLKREQLVTATSLSQTRTQLTTVAAPVPVGFIIKTLGVAWAFFIDAISFLFIIAALIKLPDPPPNPAARKPIWHSIWEGIQYVGKDIPLRSLLLVVTGLNFCLAGPFNLGLAYIAKTRFASPAVFGMMLSSAALGMLAGSLLAGVWKVRRRGRMILLVSFVLAALLSLMAIVNGLWSLAAVLLAMGTSAGLLSVHIAAWALQRIDATVRGRVSSVLTLTGLGILPFSLALAGLLIAVSLKFMFLFAASVMLLVTLVAATQKTVRQIE
ncbi:MAG TPA: MFS transporter [Candidatus Angelobacter sp.]|nr:MFS transporter [Candidatus Angelobacter sp.]